MSSSLNLSHRHLSQPHPFLTLHPQTDYITAHNSANHTYRLGHNAYSHLSADEFRGMMGLKGRGAGHPLTRTGSPQALPVPAALGEEAVDDMQASVWAQQQGLADAIDWVVRVSVCIFWVGGVLVVAASLEIAQPTPLPIQPTNTGEGRGDGGEEPGPVRLLLVLQHHGQPGGRLRHQDGHARLLLGAGARQLRLGRPRVRA